MVLSPVSNVYFLKFYYAIRFGDRVDTQAGTAQDGTARNIWRPEYDNMNNNICFFNVVL